MKKNHLVSLLVLVLLLAFNNAVPCTIFRLKAADGSIIVARSMEFAVDLKYDLILVPRNKTFTSPFLRKVPGLAWLTKYGYVGVAAMGLDYGVSDGMNEKGLSIGVLWYETNMQWQNVIPADSVRALASPMFPDWVLANFATVDELRKAIPQIRVFAFTDSTKMKSVPTVHFAVYDASGGCIVVEFDKGECNVYDNPLGIMTNAPSFPWQLSNLRQYAGMSPEIPVPLTLDGLKLVPTGHGQGMMGIPGDYTPPSRFVRLAMLTHFAEQQPDASHNLNLCEHVINTFSIPRGIIVDKDAAGKVISAETTQWVTFRDLTNRVLYFKTYDNSNLRKIDLKEVDFSVKTIRRLPMFSIPETVIDLLKIK
jgi:choloylglycine hydrolase